MTRREPRHSIVHDRWDRMDLAAARKAEPALQRARKTINDASSTGTEALDDVFFALFKAVPVQRRAPEMATSYVVNHWVVAEMLRLPQLRRLRETTVGDEMLAALACVELRHTLETIFERLSLARSAAMLLEEMQAALAQAGDDVIAANDAFDAAIDALDADPDELSEECAAAADAILSAREKERRARYVMHRTEDQLREELVRQEPEVRATLSESIGDAADRSAGVARAARAWGLAPGQLRHLDPQRRLEWAKRLKDARLLAIADLFGRIENLALSSTAEHVEDTFEEVADVELGSDLARVLPAELLLLGDPDAEMDFLARWSDGELLQYEVDGTDEAGRGGIVFCLDTSLSMAGSRELFGKALMLVLLHAARAQGRSMHVIHFGYRQSTSFSFTSPAEFTADRIVEAASVFWGSGTDFEQPLSEALALIEAEHAQAGRVRSDVVFVTDDECGVNPAFMADYLARMRAIGARTWGVLVDPKTPATDGPLWQMSEGRVFNVTDLTSGRDVRALIADVR